MTPRPWSSFAALAVHRAMTADSLMILALVKTILLDF